MFDVSISEMLTSVFLLKRAKKNLRYTAYREKSEVAKHLLVQLMMRNNIIIWSLLLMSDSSCWWVKGLLCGTTSRGRGCRESAIQLLGNCQHRSFSRSHPFVWASTSKHESVSEEKSTDHFSRHAVSTVDVQNEDVAPQTLSDNNSIRPKGPKFQPKRKRPRLPVLEYRDSWVCINKPAGMTVHRSHRQSKFELVVSTTLKRQLSRKVWTVHRLDHRTSGALLFAFNAKTCAALHTALRHGQKYYVALVRGNFEQRFGQSTVTIEQPVSVDGVLKNATTNFQCLAVHDQGENVQTICTPPCSLVVAQIYTGRRHQIRRHAFHMGMPILGDSQHGDSKVNRWWRNNMGLNRLALHCFHLDLPWSVQNGDDGDDGHDNRIQITAPLTDDFRSVLERPELNELWQEACRNEPRLSTPQIDVRSGTLGIKKKWQAKRDVCD